MDKRMEQVAGMEEWEGIFFWLKFSMARADELREAGCPITLYQADTWVTMVICVGITLRPPKAPKETTQGWPPLPCTA